MQLLVLEKIALGKIPISQISQKNRTNGMKLPKICIKTILFAQKIAVKK
jgi:hypothetical protein